MKSPFNVNRIKAEFTPSHYAKVQNSTDNSVLNKKNIILKNKIPAFTRFSCYNHYICIIRKINGRIFHNKTEIDPLYVLKV